VVGIACSGVAGLHETMSALVQRRWRLHWKTARNGELLAISRSSDSAGTAVEPAIDRTEKHGRHDAQRDGVGNVHASRRSLVGGYISIKYQYGRLSVACHPRALSPHTLGNGL
jgi:hypothetical protein